MFPFYGWGNWDLRRLSNALRVQMAEPRSKPICLRLWSCALGVRWPSPLISARSPWLLASLSTWKPVTPRSDVAFTPVLRSPGPGFSVVSSLSASRPYTQLDASEVLNYDIALWFCFFLNVVIVLLWQTSLSHCSLASVASQSHPPSCQSRAMTHKVHLSN